MPRFAQNCPEMPRNAQNTQNCQRIAQKCPKCPELPRFVFWYVLLKKFWKKVFSGTPCIAESDKKSFMIRVLFSMVSPIWSCSTSSTGWSRLPLCLLVMSSSHFLTSFLEPFLQSQGIVQNLKHSHPLEFKAGTNLPAPRHRWRLWIWGRRVKIQADPIGFRYAALALHMAFLCQGIVFRHYQPLPWTIFY